MKEILFGITALAILAGCSGRQADQGSRETRPMATDTVSLEETGGPTIDEPVRHDSIIQDSIRKVSMLKDSLKNLEKLTITPSMFIKYEKYPYGGGGYYKFKSNIAKTLESLDFTLLSKKNKKMELEVGYDVTTLMKFSRELNGNKVEIEYLDGICGELHLKFDNTVEKNNFIKQIQRLPHFFKEGSNSYSDGDDAGIYIETKGNQITFTRMCP